MKDRLYHVLDPMVIQQYRLRKPESPFKSVHQPIVQTNSFGQHSTTGSSNFGRKSSGYQPQPTVNNNLTNNAPFNPGNFNSYPQNQNTGNLYPVASVNHPMPISSIYQAQDLNKRSATPTFNKPLHPSAPSIPTMPTTLSSQPPTEMGISRGTPTSTFYTPAPTSTTTSSQPPTSQAQTAQSFMHAKPATAWNDPPMVAPKVKANPVKTEMDKPAFFQPTMPSAPMNNQYQFQNQFQSNQQAYQSQPPSMPQYQPMQPPVQQYQQTQTFQPTIPTQQQPQVQQPVQPPVQEKPVEKGPIPAEHQELQTVFDTLLNKCVTASNVPTTKRKLEDVAKKLEVLYDKLRDSTVWNFSFKKQYQNFILFVLVKCKCESKFTWNDAVY